MKFKSIVVTGTDTGVGKTTVACGIAAALSRNGCRVGVFKPAETGCAPGSAGPELEPADAVRLQFFSACRVELRTICPHALRAPLAPLVAAQQEGYCIDFDGLLRCHDTIAADHDVTLIEGAGGLLAPITPARTLAELAQCAGLPVAVVVGSRLGALNHALLTVRYAQSIGLQVLGYIVNFPAAGADVAARTNVEVLTNWIGPPLGVVPYLGEITITAASRQRLAEIFAARVRLDELLVPC